VSQATRRYMIERQEFTMVAEFVAEALAQDDYMVCISYLQSIWSNM
jgi:hypothetical protein